jgi:O-antigen/teichoic acid export membrane protein
VFAYFFFSGEILKLLFSDASAVVAEPMLMIAAPSVFFSAMLIMSNTVLEASGLASAPLISVGAGSVVKIFLAYILIGRIGILGAPISTVFCYFVSFVISNVIMRVRLRLKISILALSFVPFIVLILLFTVGKRFYECFIMDNGSALNFLIFSAVMAFIYLIFAVVFLRKRLRGLTYYVEIAKNDRDTL